jgi:hypothetical protein
MQPHASDRRSLKRQVTLARPLLLVLSLVSVLELPAPPPSVLIFQGVYLAASLLFAAAQATAWGADWKFPLAADVAALGAFLVFAPSVAPMWFLLLFVAFAAAVEWGIRPAYWIVVASSAAVLVWTLLQHHAAWEATETAARRWNTISWPDSTRCCAWMRVSPTRCAGFSKS